MQDVDNLLWVEKYRPRKISDTILPARLKDYFQAMVDKGDLQNMTLSGSAGTGKTTVARALCEELGYDYIVINASKERNIDTIRTTVIDYGSTMSLHSSMKVIILDEADHLNLGSAQPALRGVIEELSGSCRFILTCNFQNKLMDPLLSRCPPVEFSFTKEEKKTLGVEFAKRVRNILRENEIEFETEQLLTVVGKNFPDFRKTLNLMQRYTSSGKLEMSSATSIGDDAIRELVKYLRNKDFTKMRKWVVDHLDNDGAMLRQSIYDKAAQYLDPSSIPEVVLFINKYDFQEGFVSNKEINMVAMLTEIMASADFLEE